MSKKLKQELETALADLASSKAQLAELCAEIDKVHTWFRLPRQNDHLDPNRDSTQPIVQLAEIADFRDQTGYPNVPVKISGTKPDGTRYTVTVCPQELIYDTATQEWQLKCGTYAEGTVTHVPLSEIDRWF